MKKYALERLLAAYDDDAEVFIEDSDGNLHEFRADHRPEVFDGFDTAYDAGVNLVMTD